MGYITKKQRHFSRVDTVFYDENKKLLGVSEIFTIDGAHGAFSSEELAKKGHYYLTPRDSLKHMINHGVEEPDFIMPVTILLKKAKYIVPWKTGIEEIDSEIKASKNYYEVFKPYWIKLKEEIKIENSLLIVSEDGIERF